MKGSCVTSKQVNLKVFAFFIKFDVCEIQNRYRNDSDEIEAEYKHLNYKAKRRMLLMNKGRLII